MTRQHWWIAAALALLLLVGIGVAAVVTYEPSQPEPTRSPSPATSTPAALPGRATIAGQITELSSKPTDGFLLLHVPGLGYLSIMISDPALRGPFAATVTVAVPESFDASEDPVELFRQLEAYTMETGEALEVVDVVR